MSFGIVGKIEGGLADKQYQKSKNGANGFHADQSPQLQKLLEPGLIIMDQHHGKTKTVSTQSIERIDWGEFLSQRICQQN